MDARGLLSALISHYTDRREHGVCSAADLLTHAAMVVKGFSDEEEAIEYIGEEITERRIARS